MALTPTDISLVFLGILIVLVLFEVRKLSRRREPVERLEAHVERLSRQMAQMGAPPELELPGGAQLVEVGQSFESISEQLERLGESAVALDDEMMGEEAVRRFRRSLAELRVELDSARVLFEQSAAQLGGASEAMRSGGAALQHVQARLEALLAPGRGADRT